MAYEIHIERRQANNARPKITLEEWTNALSTVGGTLTTRDSSAINPATGEVITGRNLGGDAQLGLTGGGSCSFAWSPGGRITFRAPQEFGDPDSAVRVLARNLAEKLAAIVVGDEGEEYP